MIEAYLNKHLRKINKEIRKQLLTKGRIDSKTHYEYCRLKDNLVDKLCKQYE